MGCIVRGGKGIGFDWLMRDVGREWGEGDGIYIVEEWVRGLDFDGRRGREEEV